MTVDSLIQIIALIIAVYALVSRARRLELRVRFGIALETLGIIYIIVVIIFLYYEAFQKLGILPVWPKEWLFFPKDVAFFITLFVALFSLIAYRKTKLSKKDIFNFQELAEELLRREEYPELISILDRHWKRLIQIQSANFVLSRTKKKLTSWLTKINPQNDYENYLRSLAEEDLIRILDEVYDDENDDKTTKEEGIGSFRQNKLFTFFRQVLWNLTNWLVNLLPDNLIYAATANDLLRTVFLNEKFVVAIANIRPYFALEILDDEFPQKKRFLDLYLRGLIRNPYSIFYVEIEKNLLEMRSPNSYDIPRTDRFLNYFLGDARKAESLSIWKPIGDEVLRILDVQAILPDDEYNYAINPFDDNDLWQSDIFVGVQFFGIMVSQALFQGINWHMWLYYFPAFVEKIVKNYKPYPSVDLSAEWPTKYSYILYEIVKISLEWVKIAESFVVQKQSNVIIEHINDDHENGNIPKSSLISLGFCLKHILETDAITEKFKQYLMDIVFDCYFELRKNPLLEDYALVLRKVLRPAKDSYTAGFRFSVEKHFKEYVRTTHHFDDRKHVEEFLNE